MGPEGAGPDQRELGVGAPEGWSLEKTAPSSHAVGLSKGFWYLRILVSMVGIVKAMVFPGIIYRCESWTIKKAEC